MAKSKLVKANEKIAEKVVSGYKTVEQSVVGGYQKIEETIVGGYRKIEDAFVDQYLTHNGETIEDAKVRLHTEQEKRGSRKQHDVHAKPGVDYVQQAQEHTADQVSQIQEMAHVSEKHTKSN